MVDGKKLMIYVNGGKHHARRLAHAGSGVYWISNTLTDDISNRADDRDRGLADPRRSRGPPPAPPASLTALDELTSANRSP